MKKILVISLLFSLAMTSIAQQEPQYTMFWNNQASFNPAYSGLENDMDASLTYRGQWRNITIPINTWNFNTGMKLPNINSGVGLNFTHDAVGFSKTNKINLNYNYQLLLKDSKFLSAGLAFGVKKRSVDYSTYLPSSNIIYKGDTKINLNGGLVFKTPLYNVGIGITQITQPEFGYFYQDARHLFLSSSYKFNLLYGEILLLPFFIYKTDLVFSPNTSVWDLGTRVFYGNLFWVGTSYRHRVSINGMVGVVIMKMIDIGYSYDKGTNGTRVSTHEVAVSFKFNKENQSNSGNTN